MKSRRYFVNSSFLLIALLAVNSVFAFNGEQFAEDEPKNRKVDTAYRLPSKILPVSYDLSIFTQLAVGNFTYEGRLEILLEVVEKTNVVLLHVDKLTVRAEETSLYAVLDGEKTQLSVYQQDYDPERQLYIVSLQNNLEPGKYVLELLFFGEVQDDVLGFYRSAYEVDGQRKWAGFTEFSPGYARRAFPCMDEPYMKANYKIRIGHYANQTATSNMPIESVVKTDVPSYYITTFVRTPRLPTYIVGWAVHDFVYEKIQSTPDFTIWTRDSMQGRGSYVLKHSEKIFSALKSWLKTDYPLKKIDQFAVPDFHYNAMENWGLINYRESAVLLEEENTPTDYFFRALSTMTHEFAHTWFGNLVTPKFWDAAWLKEGFATYFQYHGLSLVKEFDETWRPSDLFVVDVLQDALTQDSQERTMNNVDIAVGSSTSLTKTLDYTAYKKGASIIRMIRHILRDLAFQRALTRYVKDMSEKSVGPYDLYEYLQEAGEYANSLKQNLKIKDIVETWTNQPGYPVVTITRNYSNNMMEISQEPFYLDREKAKKEKDERRWWIPLNLAAETAPYLFEQTYIRAWLRPQDKSQLMAVLEPEYWIVFNVQQVGYYRVNYDDNNWKMLIEQLNQKNISDIHKLNRAQLVDDSYNLARASYITYDVPVKLSRYLVRETEYEPWLAADNNFRFLHSMISNDPIALRDFKELLKDVTTPLYYSLGFGESSTDTARTKLLRNLILSLACLVGHDDCLGKSEMLFKLWVADPAGKISPNLKSFVYCTGIRSASEDEWYTVWDKFLHTDLHTEQELLLSGLGCTRNPNLINKFLNASISSNLAIRKQHRLKIVNSVVAGNPENVDHTFEFINDNLHRIIQTRGHSFAAKMLAAVGGKMITEEQLEKITRFVHKHEEQLGPSSETAKEAVISAANNVAWIKKRLLYPNPEHNVFKK